MMSTKKDLVPIFLSETKDSLTLLDKGVVELEKNPNDTKLALELNRTIHGLKGSSRIFGFIEIENIAHKIEDLFEAVNKEKLTFDSSVADKIFSGLDEIRNFLEKIATEKIPGSSEDKNESEHDMDVPEEYIRISLKKVDRTLNLIGEMAIGKANFVINTLQAKRISKMAYELEKEIADLRKNLKKLNVSKETLKAFNTCHAKTNKLKETSFDLHEKLSSESSHFEPIITELHDNMKTIRMLPLSTLFDEFPRMLRDIASQNNKKIDLKVSGGETELDKNIIEKVKTPIIHILRNCIDHGIESLKERKNAGKPEFGTISLSAHNEACSVIIQIEDDGKGIDVEKIKKTAIEKGLVSNKVLEEMSDEEILYLSFMSGCSTKEAVTHISGRGIGLDAVKQTIEGIHGQVLLKSEKDKGTEFTLILPLTIAIIKVLLFKLQDISFAFPMLSVQQTLKVDLKDILTIEKKMAIQVREHSIPLVQLSDLLGIPQKNEQITNIPQQPKNKILVIIVSYLEKQVGFIVDSIAGEEEVFIKSLGNHLGEVKNVSSAAILGNGDIAVILNVAGLISSSTTSGPVISAAQQNLISQKRILVVDDFLSTREVEKNILEEQGYLVECAADGLDAMEKLAKANFDLIVSDIKMPRMNGFEFCKALKESDDYRAIPVIIVTSLEKEEEKRHGMEVGASAYILKNTFDQSILLDTIKRLIG